MKTAISIPENVFREVDTFAKQHHFSRSEVFVKAVQELLQKKTSLDLLNALNKAYAEPETHEDRRMRKALTRNAIRILKEEKY